MSRRPSHAVIAALTAGVLLAGLATAGPAAADQGPTVSVSDVTVAETDSGTTPAVFTITLSRAVPNPTTVTYSTSDNQAKAPGDYAALSGQLVIAPGTTTRTVTVDVVGDTRYEGDESFSLYIGSPSGGVTDNQGIATVVDDDPQPYVSVADATVTEGNTGTVTATFPVTLDRPSAQPVRVRYGTTNGSAAAGGVGAAPADYTYTHGTLTIPAGQTAGSIAVTVNGDTFDEGNYEYFYLGLSAPVGATVTGNAAVGTIVDDDGTPMLSVRDAAVVEGNSGTSSLVFRVTLTSASAQTVTAFYSTGDGTAGSADYATRTGGLVFTPGQVAKTVTVPVTGDTADENTEYLYLYVSDVTGAAVADNQAYGEIVDDDPTATAASFLTLDGTAVTETDTGLSYATFTVLLQPAAATTVTVNYATSDSSAVAGTDYTATNGTLTIAAGATSATIKVPVRGDDIMESDEGFYLRLSGATNAVIDDDTGYGVIVNDDVAPVASVGDVTVAEGDSGTGDAAIEISLSGPTAVTSSVVYTTNNSSAAAPGDYTTVSATAVFQPGETSKIVHVPTVGDTIDENDESFYVYLSSPNNLIIADNYGYVVITDDDRNPAITVSDPSVFEGTGGTVSAVVTVSLSAKSPNTVTVNYGTGNGSAAEPTDYTATTGTLTFTPGQTARTVAIPVISDSLDENGEYFYLYVGSPSNAYLSESYGTVTIHDDDSAPLISVGEAAVQEPNSGSAAMTFTVTLSSASLNTVTVNYGTSDGSAVAPGDYTATSGTLTFTPGQTSKTVAVTVLGDTIAENNEYVNFSLNNAVNAYVRDSYSYGTIWNTDVSPNLSVDDIGVVEGNSGTKNATFTVRLQPASPNVVTVVYGTGDGTAVAGSGDYTTTTGTLTFAAGQTSKTVNVPITGDTIDENQEYFGFGLSSPVNAFVYDANAYATIFDNDPDGAGGSILSIDEEVVVEGDSGTTDAVFPVTISPAPTAPVTVNYRTNTSTASETDYAPQIGTLTFATGQTSATITVPVNGDTYDENDETFSVSLFSARGPVTYGETSAWGIILDDDRLPLVSVNDIAVGEGGAGTTPATFTVRLSQASTQPVSVDWDTRDGSAVAPGDYQADGGTVTFAPGETTKTVTLTVNGDDLVEGDEVFYVDLSGLIGAYRASSEQTGYVTVLDTDAYAVMGTVTKPGGTGASGMRLTLTGNQQPTQSVLSAADGSYAFDDLPDGIYKITPSATGRTFLPAAVSVLVRGGSATAPVLLAVVTPGVSGRILDSAGKAVAGATVTRTGNSQATVTTTTNSLGYYGFSSNPVGTYVITPTATGATFSPTSRSVTVTATTSATADFTKS